jgi:L-lactate dehydrogenase
VLTLANLTNDIKGLEGVSLSLPRVLGADGIMTTIAPSLSEEEHNLLIKSADILRQAATDLNL